MTLTVNFHTNNSNNNKNQQIMTKKEMKLGNQIMNENLQQ